MPYAKPVRKSQWDKRIARAAELEESSSYAAEVLTFYRAILEFQRKLYDEAAAPAPSDAAFRERLNLDDALRHLPTLLSLVEDKGPAKLAADAATVRAASTEERRQILQMFLAGEPIPQPFFARALLQPYAERLASPPPSGITVSTCPVCGARPQAAVLRPEGEGGKRFLLCSLCLTEWEFRRVLCPICGETDYQKLPRYSPEAPEHVRVEACDTCHFYLKSIDLTLDGHAVPVVDEVATVPLDLWAAEHGYKKAEPNLMGF